MLLSTCSYQNAFNIFFLENQGLSLRLASGRLLASTGPPPSISRQPSPK
jgi:hypothetical protein